LRCDGRRSFLREATRGHSAYSGGIAVSFRPVLKREALGGIEETAEGQRVPGAGTALGERDDVGSHLKVRLDLLSGERAEDHTGGGGQLRERAQGLSVIGDPLTATHYAQIMAVAAAGRLPAMCNDRDWVTEGGLMAVGVASYRTRRSPSYS